MSACDVPNVACPPLLLDTLQVPEGNGTVDI
jgi:hypothetical protein